MGPPPKYLIERKLVRHISKKVVPKAPLIPPQYFTDLANCWKQHGVGSSKCIDDQLKYDFAIQQTRAFYEKMEKMKIKNILTSQLKRPIYHRYLKGKYKPEYFKNYDLIKFYERM